MSVEMQLNRLYSELEKTIGKEQLSAILSDKNKTNKLVSNLFIYSDLKSSHDLSHLHIKKKPAAWRFIHFLRKLFGINRRTEYDFYSNSNSVKNAFSTLSTTDPKLKELKAFMLSLSEHVEKTRKPYDLHFLAAPHLKVDTQVIPKSKNWNLVIHNQEVASIPGKGRVVVMVPYPMDYLFSVHARNRALDFSTKASGNEEFIKNLKKISKSDMLICFVPKGDAKETEQWNKLSKKEQKEKIARLQANLKDVYLVEPAPFAEAIKKQKFYVFEPYFKVDSKFYDHLNHPPLERPSKISKLFHACIYKIKN